MITNDDISTIMHESLIKHIQDIYSNHLSEVQEVCNEIDHRLVQKAHMCSDFLSINESEFHQILLDHNIDSKLNYDAELSTWGTIIAYLYQENSFYANSDNGNLYISWDDNVITTKDLNSILKDNNLIDKASSESHDKDSLASSDNDTLTIDNLDDDISSIDDINSFKDNANSISLSDDTFKPFVLDDNNTLKSEEALSNDDKINNDAADVLSTDDSDNIVLDAPTSQHNTSNEKDSIQETIDDLNQIFQKFQDYFHSKYLTKNVKHDRYSIRLKVYENISFKYFFVWHIDCDKFDRSSYSYSDSLFETLEKSIKFVIFDKKKKFEFEARPTILQEVVDGLNNELYSYYDYKSISTMLPIVHGYMRSSKRVKLYEQAKNIHDFKSFKKTYYKYHLKNILWINATAPNSLCLTTYRTAKPQLNLIVQKGPTSIRGTYFVRKFDWSKYHSDAYAQEEFYRYVWHEVVNFYYFKQDYYLYTKIFNRGNDCDFRSTFANYSVDCRLLATKANIIHANKPNKDLKNVWSTTSMPVRKNSSNITFDNYFNS